MRIVHAVGWYLPESVGGTELYVAAVAARLQQQGHEVLVAAPDATQRNERRYTQDGVPTYRFPIPAVATRDQARGVAHVPGAERFHRMLVETAPAIVHFHTFVTGLGLAAVTAARDAGAGVIVTSHAASLGFTCERGTLLHRGEELCDGRYAPARCARCVLEQRGLPSAVAAIASQIPIGWSTRAMRAPGRLGSLLAMPALIAGNRVAQQRLFEIADAVVVLSDWAAALLKRNGAPADKVVVNRLGIDSQRGDWQRKPDLPTHTPLVVGYLGRAEAIKGFDDLVRAVLSLSSDVAIELRAVILASSTHEHQAVAQWRDSTKGDSRIVIRDSLDPRAVPAFLAELDVLVCPSRSVEGGPTVALEAHAVGTPVIGSAMPALTEYVTHGVNGALFPPGDWRALARCLSELVENPATVDRFRRQLPQPRTFDEVTADYVALYDQALS